MSNKPHSRVKRVSDKTIRVEKKEIKSTRKTIKEIIGAFIKK